MRNVLLSRDYSLHWHYVSLRSTHNHTPCSKSTHFDSSENSFVMVVCEKKISCSLDITFWLNLDLIFSHRKLLKRFPDQSEVSVLPAEYCRGGSGFLVGGGANLQFYKKNSLKLRKFRAGGRPPLDPPLYCMVDLIAQSPYFTDKRFNSGFYGQLLVFNDI